LQLVPINKTYDNTIKPDGYVEIKLPDAGFVLLGRVSALLRARKVSASAGFGASALSLKQRSSISATTDGNVRPAYWARADPNNAITGLPAVDGERPARFGAREGELGWPLRYFAASEVLFDGPCLVRVNPHYGA
jgi:hypothetical protein